MITKMLFIFAIFCQQMLGSFAYYDNFLSHTALERVPGSIGGDVELRCTKIIERIFGDVVYTPQSCSPEWNDNCYHEWSKNDEIINKKKNKYKLESKTTYDYCENFFKTSELVHDLIPGLEDNEWSRDILCYASILKIQNIEESDFGEYTCNLSLHDSDKKPLTKSELKVITLYDKDISNEETVPSVHFIDSYYIENNKFELLAQCTTLGGNQYWIVYDPQDKECGKIGNCEAKSWIIDEFSEDSWRCFDYQYNSHYPYPGITESFIFFQNICPSDYLVVNCAVDIDGVATSNYSNRILVKEQDFFWTYYDNSFGIIIAITISVIIPILGVFILAASIVACVRGKICCPRRKHHFVALQQRPVVQNYTSDPHYHVQVPAYGP